MKKESKIVYLLICFGCFTISFNVAVISALVPVISEDFQLSKLVVAKLIPYYLMPYGVGALIFAPLTRMFSFRHVYLCIAAIYGVSSFLCAVASDLNTILYGRIAMGLSAAGIIPIGLMLIGEIFDKNIRGRLVGVFFSHAFIASIVGLIVGGIWNWRFVFLIPSILAIVLFLGVYFCPIDSFKRKQTGRINYLAVLGDRSVLKVFIFIFGISFLYHGVHKWYGVYLSDIYAFDQWTINVFVVLTVVCGMLGQILGGFLSDKKGRVFTVKCGVVGLSLSTMLLFGMYSKLSLAVILGLISIFWTIGHNGISTVLTDFSDENRAVVASLNSSVRFISGGLGFIVSKYFVEYSFSWTFMCIGFLMFLLFFSLKRVIPQG